MKAGELLRWQWNGYPQYHQSRANLMLHIVVVPLFLVANVGLVLALFSQAWLVAGLSVLVMGVSVALQGRGHSMEPQASVPFSSPLNALARIFFEQWITFPRFVLSGAWSRALRSAS